MGGKGGRVVSWERELCSSAIDIDTASSVCSSDLSEEVGIMGGKEISG